MSDINRDDIRAAVGAGMITEAQAASLIALGDARRGTREHMSGLDEPFELFRGFNEIFIVVGLGILFSGWAGLTGVSYFSAQNGYVLSIIYALIGMGAVALLARYFTLTRRMVAPSIALAIFFAMSAGQLGISLGWMLKTDFPQSLALSAGLSTLLLVGYYIMFRVPFTMALIALGVFGTAFGLVSLGGNVPTNPSDIFLLTAQGPFAILTILLGLLGLIVALRFDMSDPHRISRRAASGFWLHVIVAPTIVNTVALSLFDVGTVTAQLLLVLFVACMAIFAVVIDRRSFLVSGVGYIVALSITVMEGNAFLVILLLGLGLVLLGAKWEVLRRNLMDAFPDFPGKTRLPPWTLLTAEEPQS
ncbi:hypothetical protein E2K80_16125 [Rhodophyticola sp. CCM32]|uniref:hypothetical protein n=1 Tax=Rhodophyticola sp. CCM32 TaxID=2916397 RepID=UPI00107FACB5|nr:hypothetical protein [Rhodophyticola sp. CCM32]QBY02073.1 hypothetical protein E2K80_16125 [Rhodophyticola sp. CCM32]